MSVLGVVVALALLAGACASTTDGDTGQRPAGSPTSSTAAAPSVSRTVEPDTKAARPGDESTPLAGPDYRGALRDLAVSDTSRHELLVIAEDDPDDPGLQIWPRGTGSWRLSTSEGELTTRGVGAPGQFAFVVRAIEDDVFFRVEMDDSRFGRTCWGVLGVDGPVAEGLPATGGLGAPGALLVLDRYRPAGRSEAGTTSLEAALGAIGFQKVVTADRRAVRGIRVPVDLDLEGGRFSRALVYPSDVIAALDDVESDAIEVSSLVDVLDGAVLPLFWAIVYDGFGDELTVERPRASSLLLDGETCTD